MWNTPKTLVKCFVAFIVALLCILLGIERKRTKKALETIEELKEENYTTEVEKTRLEQAVSVSEEVIEGVKEVQSETEQKIEEVRKADSQKKAYNDIVGRFNK